MEDVISEFERYAKMSIEERRAIPMDRGASGGGPA